MDVIQDKRILDFLLRQTVPTDPTPLIDARDRNDIGSPRKHFEILSRAALLLHIAGSAMAERLRSASIQNAELEVWWRKFGLERALWESGAPPVAPSDLWASVADVVQSVEDKLRLNPSQDLSPWADLCMSEKAPLAGEVLALCHLAA